jgi:putative endonuclease
LYSISFDKLYIGQTNNLSRRIKEHNEEKVNSTKPYVPYEIIWFTEKSSRKEAMLLERKLKNLKSNIRLKKFIEKYS